MQLSYEELKLQSLIEYFYAIPGVPSKAVKPEQLNSGLHHHKVFIQSTSQGSRCLKAGTKILYLKEVLCTLHACMHHSVYLNIIPVFTYGLLLLVHQVEPYRCSN